MRIFWFLMAGLSINWAIAQDVINQEVIEYKGLLLKTPLAQFEATAAINDMYNFKFERANNQFKWFREKYPNHPMPEFLLGLSDWWQMMPNPEDRSKDESVLRQMDLSIEKAKKLFDANPENAEAAFFLSASYAFKSRLHGERKHWLRATSAGKNALNYLKVGKVSKDLSPELLFGEGLYNYYSVWIKENYAALKPLLLFFKKGDKALGLKQLEDVAGNSFYTRTEAQYMLMRIYRNEESQPLKALPIAEYLAKTFPDNAYFQRYYAGIAYSLAMFEEAERVSKDILQKISAKQIGYEAISGRYAAFILAYLARVRYNDLAAAEQYYQQAISFAESTKSFESGYYLASLQDLGRMYHTQKQFAKAQKCYELLKKHSKRKSKQRKEAKKHLREYRDLDFEE
jgi:tetratricopeptide (TPR) repeat protein